jgi:hypothetical protein
VSDLAASLPGIGKEKIEAFWWLIGELSRHGTSREAINDGSWFRLSQQRAALMGTSPSSICTAATCVGNTRWHDAETGWRAIRITLVEALWPYYMAAPGYEKLNLKRAATTAPQKMDAYYHTEFHLAMLVDHIVTDLGKAGADALWNNPLSVAKQHLPRVTNASGRLIHSQSRSINHS